MKQDYSTGDLPSNIEEHIELNSKIRNIALDALGKKIKTNTRNNVSIGVIILKILSLKEINTSFGFNEGDALLLQCLKRIRQVLLPEDLIYRISENEFLICLSKIINEGHIVLAAYKLSRIFTHSFPVGSDHISIKITMGIAIHPDHAETAEDLLKKASAALDTAIKEGHAYSVWSSKGGHVDKSNIVIETELRESIDNNTFMINYQPKLDIRNNTIAGVEALIRWDSPTYGSLLPDFFIPIAEKAGLIDELTLNIINSSLRESREWPDNGSNLTISINLSTVNLQSETIVELIERAVNIWGADPELLVFEVTESAMMLNPELSLNILNQINNMGCHCAIDDFGTGYSSFAYLKKLPVSELKIDKSFVLNMVEDKEDAIIAGAIIELAHSFKLSVTAEGVENNKTLKQLSEMGCEFAQGYHIAIPMTVDKLIHWLEKSKAISKYHLTD